MSSECWASIRAVWTTSRACPDPSAVFFTVAVISSKAAAVSSRLAACCSVRRHRSSEEVANLTRAGPDGASIARHLAHRLLELGHSRIEVGPQSLVLGGKRLAETLHQIAAGELAEASGQALDHLGLLACQFGALGIATRTPFGRGLTRPLGLLLEQTLLGSRHL